MNLGEALQGLGMGMSGRGAEWAKIQQQERLMEEQRQAQEAQRQKQIQMERLKAHAQDTRSLRMLLEKNKPEAAQRFLQNRISYIKEQGQDPRHSMQALEALQSGNTQLVLEDLRNAEMYAVNNGLLQEMATPETRLKRNEITDGGQIVEMINGKPVARNIEGYTPEEDKTKQTRPLNPVLLEGLSPQLAHKANAAYEAAGGGKEGFAAFTKMVEKGTEQERRATAPKILSEAFPKADEAELTQLQSVMNAAKTTEEGLKEASKVREEQRRMKKAQVFRDRTVQLLHNILSNDELNDVLGGLEGSVDVGFLRGDNENDLIADIQEAKNILTVDNLDLMVGVLSESDIKLLKNLSAGALDRTRSESRFVKDANMLLDKLTSANFKTGTKTPSGKTVKWEDL